MAPMSQSKFEHADAAQRVLTASAGPRLTLIAESFARLTGRALLAETQALEDAAWDADFVLLAHGAEPDPRFFYGNRRALQLFELTPGQLVGMPSRLSAEAPDRAARAALLDEVARRGFIENYAGVRIARSGRRFRIAGATVWNLIDATGALHGQAAAFSEWTRLD